MSNYTPPNIDNLSFTFTEDGYAKPDFNTISFYSKAYDSSLSNLQASVEVMQLYQESTYTYIKECRSVIVGFSNSGVQTIKLPCKYGGIRDLGTVIQANFRHVELSAYIKGITGAVDLPGYIKILISGSLNLDAYTKPIYKSNVDLFTYLTGNYINVDLSSIVNVISFYALSANLQTQLLSSYNDLSAYSNVFIRNNIDLDSYLNIIDVSDLPVDINPSLLKGSHDLISQIRLFYSDINDFSAVVQGWVQTDLASSINQIYSYDLNGRILATLNLDLSASVYGIPPIDLSAYMHAFGYSDLSSYISGGFGPTDLTTSLSPIKPINLNASLISYLGINNKKDLHAKISSYNTVNLTAYLYAGGLFDLNAQLEASGSTYDLYAYLFPKVVHVKKIFSISLLSTKNMFAVINAACFNSSYVNLNTTLYSYDNRNLQAFIYVGDNYGGDLPTHINYGNSLALSSIPVLFVPDKKHTSITLNVTSKSSGKALDSIHVVYSILKSSDYVSLNALLHGTKFTNSNRDLNSTLECTKDPYFSTFFGEDDFRFKVLNLKYNGTNDWKREIELIFSSQAKKYRYISAEKKAYRRYRDKHWIISVIGFNFVSGLGVERGKVRKKYIFDLRKYKSVDEAIRDAIDRVSSFRKTNLKSSINGIKSAYNHKNMNAKLFSMYTGNGLVDLSILMKGVSVANSLNLNSLITGRLPLVELTATIIGENYSPKPGNLIDFNFSDEDILDSVESIVDLNFIPGE